MLTAGRPDRARIAVALTAISLRILAVVTLGRQPEGLHDPLVYQRFAQGIAKGQGYVSWNGEPTAYYPAGYPWFLGIIQWCCNLVGLDDHLVLVAGLVQALLGGVAAWALVGVGQRLHSNPAVARRAGLAAGLILAVWPNLVLHSATLLSESLFLGAFCLTLLGLTRLLTGASPRGTRAWWGDVVLAGIPLGISTLTRPQVLTILVAYAVAVMFTQQPDIGASEDTSSRWRHRAAIFLAPAVLGALVVIPWTIRNAVVFDRFVAVSTNGGDNLCIGFNPSATGHFGIPDECQTGEFYIDGPDAEARRNAETSKRARSWALDNLGALPELSARKIWYTYDNDTDALRAIESYENDRFLPSPVRTALTVISNTFYVVVMLVAAVGVGLLAIRARRGLADRTDPALVGVALILGGLMAAFLPIFFFGEARFKVPATPFFALFAAVALADAARRWIRTEQDATSEITPA